MKLNWAERLAVNNPMRVVGQRIEVRLLKAKNMLPVVKGAVALELGCGRGAGARLILKQFRPYLLHTLDLDIQMLQKAKEYLSPRELRKLSLCAGDVFRLPFKEDCVDVVFGFGVLHHVLEWRGALREIARVLKPGGAYVVEELYPALYLNLITRHLFDHPRYDRFYSRDLRQAMRDVKLPIKDAIEFKRLGILGVAIKAS